MANITIETATIRLYIIALGELKKSPDPETRAYANEVLETLETTSVIETLAPLITLPVEKLVPSERVLRFTVQKMIRNVIKNQLDGGAQ